MRSPNPSTWLTTRRSIRKFTADPVPADLLQEILAAALLAPSAHNLQPWRFAHIHSQQARQALGQSLTQQMRRDMQAENTPETEIVSRIERSLRRIAQAPEILLLCRDTQAVRLPAPEEDLMAIQSVAMCGLQLMLAAHTRGLAANWICWPLYAQSEIASALHLPATWQPQGMIFLGFAAEQPAEKQIQPIQTLLVTC